MQSILLVCLGNICRSPMAEAVIKAQLPGVKLVASAGVSAVGGPMDARAAAALERRGHKPLKKFRSKPLEAADFERYDLILAMDSHNLATLRKRQPEGSHAQVKMLLDYAPGLEGQDVPDPYYGPAAGFDQALTLIEKGVAGLGEAIARQAT